MIRKDKRGKRSEEMVHKKYIKRNGKIFGPYYSTSYREGGKVKTRYIGKVKTSGKRFAIPAIIAAVLIIIVLFFFLKPSIIGLTTKEPLFILDPIQSHPIVGGSWVVQLNTEGTANLTIRAAGETTWSNENDNEDIRFLEIRCGDDILDYKWIDNSVFIADYSCDETAYHTVKVLTKGIHVLEFKFGSYTKYAYNSVVPNKFIIQNSTGYNVAYFDDFGNIMLEGNCTCGGTCTAPAHSFIIKDSDGETVAYVDPDGNLCIETCDCSDQSASCSTTPNDAFIVKNETDSIMSYIDITGDLCLTGTLTTGPYPKISVTFPANNSYLDQTWINITGTASDANPDTVYVNDTRFGSNNGTYQSWNFTNTTSIAEGTYSVLIMANDSANNTNSTLIVFTIDRTVPNITNMSISPSAAADVDPNVNISVTVNVSDANTDTVILQYWNYSTTVDTCTNVTMSSVSGDVYNATFNASVSGTWYYQVWANDTVGHSINNTPNSIDVQYECTWEISDTIDDLTLGTLKQQKSIGNITINNTGDEGYYLQSCALVFYIKNTGEGTISFSDSSHSLNAGEAVNVTVTATFPDEAKEEEFIITITELDAITTPSSTTSNGTLASYVGGAYLNVVINVSPNAVNQTDTLNFALSAYVQNIGNETAYNVTLNWTLPAGWSNVSGSLNSSVATLNCSDPTISPNCGCTTNSSFNTFVSEVTATVSDPMSAAVGIVTISIDSGSNTSTVNDSASTTATVSCHGSAEDDYCNPDTCTYLNDPNCEEPSPITETVTTGGGGGAGAAPATVVSTATYELVRGKDESFYFEVKNPYKDALLRDVKMKITGYLAKYITIEPATLDKIQPNSTANFTIHIIAPAYFTVGEHNLTFTISSTKEIGVSKATRTEKCYVTLVIHELGRENAVQLIALSKDYIEEMRALELNTKEVRSLLEQSQEALEKSNYEKVQELSEKIKSIAMIALEIHNKIVELEKKIEDAERKRGIKVEGTRRMLGLAKAASDRGDYDLALERAKEAELTYALETKGEFNLFYFVARNTLQVFFGTLIALALLAILFFKAKLMMVNHSLTGLREEEGILLGLMRTLQHECFIEKKLSMKEYFQSMIQYEDKLGKTIQRSIALESAKVNLFKLKSARLELERKRLLDLMKETQSHYMKEKKMDTRVYNRRMQSYSIRLSEVEEEIATREAGRALRRDKLRRFLQVVAFVKALKVSEREKARRIAEKRKKEAILERLRKEKEKLRREELLKKLKLKEAEELKKRAIVEKALSERLEKRFLAIAAREEERQKGLAGKKKIEGLREIRKEEEEKLRRPRELEKRRKEEDEKRKKALERFKIISAKEEKRREELARKRELEELREIRREDREKLRRVKELEMLALREEKEKLRREREIEVRRVEEAKKRMRALEHFRREEEKEEGKKLREAGLLKIKEYIQQTEKMGFADEQIEAKLAERGWPSKFIKGAFKELRKKVKEKKEEERKKLKGIGLEKIKDYIKKTKEDGFSDKQIKAKLAERGWPAELIEKAFSELK